MLGQMLPQIAMWFLLALCITIGFSLFLTLLLPGHVALDATSIQWPGQRSDTRLETSRQRWARL